LHLCWPQPIRCRAYRPRLTRRQGAGITIDDCLFDIASHALVFALCKIVDIRNGRNYYDVDTVYLA
jgi:hypothetical protein